MNARPSQPLGPQLARLPVLRWFMALSLLWRLILTVAVIVVVVIAIDLASGKIATSAPTQYDTQLGAALSDPSGPTTCFSEGSSNGVANYTCDWSGGQGSGTVYLYPDGSYQLAGGIRSAAGIVFHR